MMIILRLFYKINNTIYYIPKTIGPKLLVLTNNYHSMIQVYPDIYQTMTEVPDLLDTSEVTNMNSMFNSCKSLTTIPQVDTSKATSMNMMFYWCEALTTVPQMDTNKVADTSGMFSMCMGLTSIPQLNTSNVTNMSQMFHYCWNLTSIPELNTSKVTSMWQMFEGCTHLPSEFPWVIDCSSITKASNMTDMFKESSVTKVTLANVHDNIKSQITSNLLKGDNTLTINFVNRKVLTNSYYKIVDVYPSTYVNMTTILDLLDTSNVTTMKSMFDDCQSLTTLDLSNFDTSNVTGINGMFDSCFSLTTLDVSNWNTSNVTVMSTMFFDCRSLTTLDLSSFDTSKVTAMKNMFRNTKLSNLTLNFDMSSITNKSGVQIMLYDCIITSGNIRFFNVRKSVFTDRATFINAISGSGISDSILTVEFIDDTKNLTSYPTENLNEIS